MRATTFSIPNVSRATRAEMTLELSPLLTAAKADGPLDAGLDEGVAVEADAGHPLPGEVGAEAAEGVAVAVDDGDRVATALEPAAERRPDATTSHDHDVHRADGTRGRRSRRPRQGAGDVPGQMPSAAAVPFALVATRDLLKRLIVGRALSSDRMGETLLPKRIALPVFASDALSSVAYAPDEIFLTLAIAGVAAYTFSWKIAIVVAIVMVTVVASYRQNVHAYPSGGGDYEVATVNLGGMAGLSVASALLVDYVLTVAVSISSAAQYAASAVSRFEGHQALIAVGATVFLMGMNLRGVRESGTAFAAPTYVFMVAIVGMTAIGLARYAFGSLPPVESADLTVVPHPGFTDGITGFAGAFLLLRAFSSGCAALTGVEAISNGVPAFKKPKSKNAATTLGLLGGIAITMVLGVIALANLTHVRLVENPATDLLRNGVPVGEDFHQDPVIGQLAKSVFSGFSPGFYVVAAVTGLILVLAANTAFNGFPVLGSILARDGYLPRQLHTRGDRLAYSNGIVALAVAGQRAHRGLRRAGHQADPALHRRGLRLVHAVADGHGAALDPAAADRDRPPSPRPDDALPRHQLVRAGADRSRAGRRAHHQVHPGGLHRDPRHDGPVRDHAGDPPALRPGEGRARGRAGRARGAPEPEPRHRPGVEDPPADDPRAWPTRGRRGPRPWRR